MKYLISAFTVLVIMSVPAAAQVKTKTAAKSKAPAAASLKSSLDSFSYALGINIASNLKQSNVAKLNFAALQ